MHVQAGGLENWDAEPRFREMWVTHLASATHLDAEACPDESHFIRGMVKIAGFLVAVAVRFA
jgi:hypothetical protein